MNRVFKYQFDINDEIVIQMPQDAKILTAQTQNGTPCIWALVNDEKPKVDVKFRVCGTGHDVKVDPDHLEYVGTIQMYGGKLVFHVFKIV